MIKDRLSTSERDKQIHDMIVNKGMFDAEIGRHFNLSRESIRIIRKRLNLRPAKEIIKERDMDIVKMGQNNVPIEVIMKEKSVSRSIVRRVLAKNGIKIKVKRLTKRPEQRVKHNEDRNAQIAKMCETKRVSEVAKIFDLSEASVRRAQLENGRSPFDPAKSPNAGRFIEVYTRYLIDDEPACDIKKDMGLSESQFRYAVRTGKALFSIHPEMREELGDA